MDTNAIIQQAVAKLSTDKTLLSAFESDPVKTLESKLGIDLPDEQINKVVDAIKAKVLADKASDLLGGLMK